MELEELEWIAWLEGNSLDPLRMDGTRLVSLRSRIMLETERQDVSLLLAHKPCNKLRTYLQIRRCSPRF
jgi:hypothetical protein